ncbi:MAG: response regulator [Elusimicrobia bacterium]|nr:response regulator [Elusimicrobiota bacterium]
MEEKLAAPGEKLVLIVDDDESARELFEFMVKKEGFRVEVAKDGEEGIRRIKQLMPSIVLLDLMLPRYGGYEVLRELQAGETASIPIVVMTGRYADRSLKDMIRQESNVVEFIEKPVKSYQLISTLHRVLKTEPSEKKKKGESPLNF